jgi:hypothetical protein
MNRLERLDRVEPSNCLTQYEIIALSKAQWIVYVAGFGYEPVCCSFARSNHGHKLLVEIS